jgi:uncharacterized protein (TIGR02270 family)
MTIRLIIEQHAEEASFHWLLRRAAVGAPHYNLRDLADLDSRLDAHVDGLRIAGEDGWNACRTQLPSEEPGDLFVGMLLALESRDAGRISEMVGLAGRDDGMARGAVSALGWLSESPGEVLNGLLNSLSPSERGIGVAALSVRRLDPRHQLAEWLAPGESLPRARAFRAIGELGRTDLLPLAERELKAGDREVACAAAWTTALLSGKPEALSVLATIAQSSGRHRERALQIAMRRANPHAAGKWMQQLAKDDTTLRLAVQGAGAIGDPAEIPWLIEQMKVAELARVAGESFTTITGVDLAYDDLETDRPEGFESGPTEDPADENVEMDADENLPWPDPQLIQKWWQSNRHAYQPGTRYLLGKPITVDWCKQVLRIGRQRQRAAAALEISMRQPGTPLFEVRAPGFRQKQMLGVP